MRHKKLIMAVLLTAFMGLLVTLPVNIYSCRVYAASGAAEEESENSGKNLVITVLEDIEPADIEDARVPLAALPQTKRDDSIRHLVLMSIAFICVIIYVLYFGRYEKKLIALRRETIEAEKKSMQGLFKRKE